MNVANDFAHMLVVLIGKISFPLTFDLDDPTS